jgi:hypothetical protein
VEEIRESNTHVVRADEGRATETEKHVVKSRQGSRATPWLAFLVGVLLIALIGFFFINGSARVNIEPGNNEVEVSVDGPGAPGPAPAPQAPAEPAPAPGQAN